MLNVFTDLGIVMIVGLGIDSEGGTTDQWDHLQAFCDSHSALAMSVRSLGSMTFKGISDECSYALYARGQARILTKYALDVPSIPSTSILSPDDHCIHYQS